MLFDVFPYTGFDVIGTVQMIQARRQGALPQQIFRRRLIAETFGQPPENSADVLECFSVIGSQCLSQRSLCRRMIADPGNGDFHFRSITYLSGPLESSPRSRLRDVGHLVIPMAQSLSDQVGARHSWRRTLACADEFHGIRTTWLGGGLSSRTPIWNFENCKV